MKFLIAAIFSLLIGTAKAQIALPFPGPGTAHSAVTYQGPGDVTSGAVLFYSCARTLNAAIALSTTNLCDLVANSAPTVIVCTLRATTTGKVDLNLCADGVTVPATVCGALPGGVCNVSKMYNQVAPGTNDVTNATASTQPKLTFSALGGLPGITCTNAASTAITTTGTITQNSPYTLMAVAVRTPSTATEGGVIGENGSGSISLLYTAATNTVAYRSTTSNTATASDTVFHGLAGVVPSGTNSTIVVDGSGTTATPIGGNITVAMRVCRSANTTNSLNGSIMEAGLWNSAWNSTQYGDVNTNQHSAANGYNF